MSDLKQKIGLRLKQYREENGLTKVEFARKANISAQQYRAIELGNSNMRLPTLYKLVVATGLSSDQLLAD